MNTTNVAKTEILIFNNIAFIVVHSFSLCTLY